MLQNFLTENRQVLIDRCRDMVAARAAPGDIERPLPHGVPVFLDQLIRTLKSDAARGPFRDRHTLEDFAVGTASELGASATLHGRELLDQGFTLDQVVRDYGDCCQAVMNLAYETGASIDVQEFRTFNHCLDDAIAAAVTEFAQRQSAEAVDDTYQAVQLRLGPMVQELRSYLDTASLAVRAIKAGNVGIAGATGAVLDRSLLAMRSLIDRSLLEVRAGAGTPARRRPLRLARFIDEVVTSYSLDSRALACRFTADPVSEEVQIFADRQLLFAAVGKLLQNAFKFTRKHSEVRLRVVVAGNRVLIEVEDHCGGLKPGAETELLLPPGHTRSKDQAMDPRSGHGLDVCQRTVEANFGVLRVRDVPGQGCVFSIDLALYADSGAVRTASLHF